MSGNRPQALLDFFNERTDDMIACLRDMVELESPTLEPELVNELGAWIGERLRGLGAQVEYDVQTERGNNIVARIGGDDQKSVLLIGHMDTVWPAGTLAKMPFRIEGDTAYGPGTIDMKSGLVIMLYVLEALNHFGPSLSRPITLIINSDEEMQSRFSRGLIEREAEQSAYALVFESTQSMELFTTSRPASGRFTVTARGEAAHAGSADRLGINAITELAHHIPALHALIDRDTGTIVNVGTIEGGTRPNVVAEHAQAVLSVRARTHETMAQVQTKLLNLQPVLPGASVEVTGEFHRGPFAPDAGSRALFERLQGVTRTFGIDGQGREARGGSDANLTGALGVPSIDGLGPVGSGAHSVDEQVQLSSMPVRAAIAAELVFRLATE